MTKKTPLRTALLGAFLLHVGFAAAAAPNNHATLGFLAQRLNAAAGRGLYPAARADTDPAANLKRFLQLLGMGGHPYVSDASVNAARPNCGIARPGVACRASRT